jgi:hypothetical protein
MTDKGLGVLQKELAATPPAGVRALAAEQQADLAQAIRDAKRRQAVALAEAGENALGLIPRVLRGPIRRMFG